jgi:surface antigen
VQATADRSFRRLRRFRAAAASTAALLSLAGGAALPSARAATPPGRAHAAAATALLPSVDPLRLVVTDTANLFWAINGATIMEAFNNGQCTDWAALRRPDIVERTVLAMIGNDIAHDRPELIGDWTARYWAKNAAAAGLKIGHVPRAGAIMVFQPGVLGAARPGGHVAYVERVRRNGSFEVSEMHAPRIWGVTYAWLTRADGRHRGVSYIY